MISVKFYLGKQHTVYKVLLDSFFILALAAKGLCKIFTLVCFCAYEWGAFSQATWYKQECYPKVIPHTVLLVAVSLCC